MAALYEEPKISSCEWQRQRADQPAARRGSERTSSTVMPKLSNFLEYCFLLLVLLFVTKTSFFPLEDH
jgi:hypothetical protein